MIKKINKAFKEVNSIISSAANSKAARGVSKVIGKTVGTGVEGGAGILNKGLKAVGNAGPNAKKAIGKINKENIGKATNSVIGNVLSNDDSYKQLDKISQLTKRPTLVSNKFLAADAIGDRVRSTMDVVVGASKPFVKQVDEGGLFGLKATGLGIAAAGAVSAASGTPDAVRQWKQGRQGYNYDTQAQKVAPQIPAYSNNGGATGDLVFALNNLRHGGMM